jgi:hypothetical protein
MIWLEFIQGMQKTKINLNNTPTLDKTLNLNYFWHYVLFIKITGPWIVIIKKTTHEQSMELITHLQTLVYRQ